EEIAAVINGNLLVNGTIGGEKIVSGTTISAPVIDGGEIEIGSGGARFRASSTAVTYGNTSARHIKLNPIGANESNILLMAGATNRGSLGVVEVGIGGPTYGSLSLSGSTGGSTNIIGGAVYCTSITCDAIYLPG